MTARVTFPKSAVAAEVAAVRAAPSHRPLANQDTGPGLWLISDADGVYLLGNQTRPADWVHEVVQSNEVPAHETFRRHSAWLGDGVWFIPLAKFEAPLGAEGATISIRRTARGLRIATLKRPVALTA